jgi:acylphosphatase
MKIQGKVVQVLPTQTGTSANGKEWKKSGVVMNYKDGDYEKTVMCTVMGDKVDALQSLTPGTEIEVSVNAESREYNSKWYTDLRAWKWDVVGQAAPAQASTTNDDGLPF